MPRFSEDVEATLRVAGWSPGRRVDLAPWKESLGEFVWHAAAEEFLREFGGIRVEISGSGVSVAREPFEFDPELALGEGERFAELSQKFDRQFFPVGELGQGEFFLAIDQEKSLSYLAGWAFELGPADVALEHLVKGVQAERMTPAPQ